MAEELTTANKERLVSDLKVVISDTEELLRATAGAAGEKAGELRERIAIRLRDAKERLADIEAAVVDKTKAAARATDDFVQRSVESGRCRGCHRTYPWRADRSSLIACPQYRAADRAARDSIHP